MQLPKADANVAILAYLDILDVRMDGGYRLNALFESLCRAMHSADPASFDKVFTRTILGRAAARGVVLDVDADELALTALEIAAAEA